MTSPKFVSAVLSIVLFATPAVRSQEDSSGKTVSAKAVAVSEVPMGWTTQAILSSYVNDSQVEGYMDLLIPLLQNDDGMLFLYPRFGLSSDVDPGYSLGVGARHYIASIDAIIGGNAFFDRYDSPGGNYYNQLGLGVEVLTRWVDARFNYYIPDSSPNVVDAQNVRSRSVSTSSAWGQPYATGYTIRQPLTTTTRTTTVNQLFERFEDSMEGLDAEIGVLTPWLEQYVALRWFAGYYHFNNSYGSDISGVKGRAELRFSEKLAVDATYYQDEEVTGSNWLFGVRMTIPVFMENLADGRSPFEGSFSGMFDGVNLGGRGQGDSGILRGGSASAYPGAYTAMSPFAAMAPAPTFAAAGKRGSTVRDRMVEEVMRLSGGARTSQSGFIENVGKRDVDVDVEEKTRIVVVEDSIVFVSNGRGTAGNPGTFENPLNTIQGGVNRASTLFGNRGDVFVSGTGTNYTEDVVDAGSSVKIWGGGRGFPVNGGRRFTHGSQPVLDGGFAISDVPQFTLSGFTVRGGSGGGGDGVNTDNVKDVMIVSNDISVGMDALFLAFEGTGNTFSVLGNNLHDNGEDAIEIEVDDGTVLTGLVQNNTISDSDTGFGIEDYEDVNGTFVFDVIGNNFFGNVDAIYFDATDTDEVDQTTTLNIVGNTFSDNDDAIELVFSDNDTDGDVMQIVNVTVTGNTFMNQNSRDFYMETGEIDDAGGDDANYIYNVAIRNNEFTGSGGHSVAYENDTSDADGIDFTVSFAVTGNRFMDIGEDAVHFHISDNDDDGFDNFTVDVDISNNVISDVDEEAIYVYIGDVDADDGEVNIGVNNNRISNVGSDGIDVYIADADDSSAIIGGNIIFDIGSDGLEFDGNGTSITSSPFGNNLISDVGDDIFDINDVDGQFRINGVLVP